MQAERWLREAQEAFDEADRLERSGRYAEAEPRVMRAIELQETLLGRDHPEVATCLHLLGHIYLRQGNHARSKEVQERALAIWERAPGNHQLKVARALNSLGIIFRRQGEHARAEQLYERALAIREQKLGKNHPDVATVLGNLANLHSDRGDDVRAEPLIQRALEIQESSGSNPLWTATSLNSLALIYGRQGDYDRAKPLYERALLIRKKILGESHPDVGYLLHNLGLLYANQGDNATARSLNESALSILEAALGPNHPDVTHPLIGLAYLSRDQGDYVCAESLYQRALAIREATLGKNHLLVANPLHDLAALYMDQGDHEHAETYYERAHAILTANLGNHHPNVARSLHNLARLRVAQHRLAEALPFFESSFAGSEEYLRQEVLAFSESRLTSVLSKLHHDEERLYALTRRNPGNARVRHLALSSALVRKGRSIEETANTSRTISLSLSPKEGELFDRLQALRAQRATLWRPTSDTPASASKEQIDKELTTEIDDLEADLARRSAPLKALLALPPPLELVQHVAAALPTDGVLIEFVAYTDSPVAPAPGVSPQRPGELRYLALLLFADGHTQAIDLGPAALIDRAALRLQGALAGRDASWTPAAQALHALVFRPLMPRLGKVRRLFIAPDGELALVPFAAFHTGDEVLDDRFDITYLTSGKDLLPRSDSIPPAQSVVVLADPDFNWIPDVNSSGTTTVSAPSMRSAALTGFFSMLRSTRANHTLLPLPGTRREAEIIHRLLPQSQVLMGRAATKKALLKLPTPGVLHIATHGFFLHEKTHAPSATRGTANFGAVGEAGPSQLAPDPLLRSGLELAGANASRTLPELYGHESSTVTALELSGMNLWGTQLVVLSACESGRGDVKLGQGVYGLRRSLVVAGAQTLVTSLWKVNDDTTQELMESYYRNLLSGQGRVEALRSAMRTLRKKHPHPYYWAPFIGIGQDTPLQGMLRPERDAPTTAR